MDDARELLANLGDEVLTESLYNEILEFEARYPIMSDTQKGGCKLLFTNPPGPDSLS